MQVNIRKVTPLYRLPEDNGVYIQWDISKPPSADLTFTLERAGGPEGPYTQLITNLRSYQFFDDLRDLPLPTEGQTKENLNFLSLVRTVYYRVTAKATTGETASAISEIENFLPDRQRLLARKMQRDLALTFKFNGVDVYILKRKHWGVRCVRCFDKLTKKVTESKCPTCFGTGFEGGYETPVAIKGRFGAPNSSTDLVPQGKSDTNRLRFICLDYPRMDPDDIIVDKLQNQRFLVEKQSQTELRRNTVHQSLVVSELSHDSIEYRIAVNSDTSPMVY